MEVAKAESKRKSAFADFLKVKQLQSMDRYVSCLYIFWMLAILSFDLSLYLLTSGCASIIQGNVFTGVRRGQKNSVKPSQDQSEAF